MKGTTPTKPRPYRLYPVMVRYARNGQGGSYWTWYVHDNVGRELCHGPNGFRSIEEVRAHVKRTLATLASGRLVRRPEVRLL